MDWFGKVLALLEFVSLFDFPFGGGGLGRRERKNKSHEADKHGSGENLGGIGRRERT